MTLLELYELAEDEVDDEMWQKWLGQAVEIAHEIALKTRQSRSKDYTNPFRRITYESQAEMKAVLGSINDDQFVALMETEAQQFEAMVKAFSRRDGMLN